jgi:hypothetical protein
MAAAAALKWRLPPLALARAAAIKRPPLPLASTRPRPIRPTSACLSKAPPSDSSGSRLSARPTLNRTLSVRSCHSMFCGRPCPGVLHFSSILAALMQTFYIGHCSIFLSGKCPNFLPRRVVWRLPPHPGRVRPRHAVPDIGVARTLLSRVDCGGRGRRHRPVHVSLLAIRYSADFSPRAHTFTRVCQLPRFS